MPIEEYVSENAVCIRKINGGELWEIKIGDKSLKTKDAAYMSDKKYQELKKDYLDYSYRSKKPLNRQDIEDFIAEGKAENFKNLGGYVVFFFYLKGEYNLRHTNSIKEIKRK